MKNTSFLPILFALCCLAAGCDKSNNNCDKSVTISDVLPNSNPAGYEVLIKTSGFTNAAKVLFGSVEATSRAGGQAGEIISTVPTGLSGNVEVSVEEGDCIARSGGFVVSGALPSGVQPSLPNIIVPTAPASFPTDGFTNFWPNAANASTGINLVDTLISGVYQLSTSSKEFDFNDPFFNNNPVRGTVNLNSNVIYLEIDRTAKGGTVEHFDGMFIAVPSFLPGDPKHAILLISQETGRQLLIYYPG